MKQSIFSPLLSFSFGAHFYKQRPNRIINIQYSCVAWLIEFDFYAYYHLSFHYIKRNRDTKYENYLRNLSDIIVILFLK